MDIFMLMRGQTECITTPWISHADEPGVKMNGYACRKNFTADDFFFAGLSKPGLTNNSFGSLVIGANVQKIPGLNTLGVSMSRTDYAPGGLNSPHTHPHATEIAFMLEGELEVGFITTTSTLYTKTIKKGEIFVFPKGLVRFQKNNGKVPAEFLLHSIVSFLVRSPLAPYCSLHHMKYQIMCSHKHSMLAQNKFRKLSQDLPPRSSDITECTKLGLLFI